MEIKQIRSDQPDCCGECGTRLTILDDSDLDNTKARCPRCGLKVTLCEE